jgi:hypothetical protein
MTRQLVFVHGRAQEHKDANQLKADWIEAWAEGLEKSGLQMPIAEQDIRFPYYGQTLYDLVEEVPRERVAEVIVRGDDADEEQKEFVRSVLEEVRHETGISEQQLEAVAGREVVERGPLNWEWLQGILEAVDTYVPGASGASIALATYDVYHYLKNPGVRDAIEVGVRAAMTPGVPTVVVGHSLGTVVSYSLLKRDGEALGWKVPLYVTVGSPLAISAVRKALRPIGHPACAAKWFNAMDERDVVALYPLDAARFDVTPAIENKTDVRNHTPNRHGIAGYLNDEVVARRICDALTVD